MGGWDTMRARMKGDEDGRPMVVCFSTCVDSIRTIPALQHDMMRPEDLNTHMEDHAADEWRYGCMSRPYTTKTPEVKHGGLPNENFSEIMRRNKIARGGGEGYI